MARKRYKKPNTGVRYARVPSGIDTCDWCYMLAARGAVYYNEISAGRADVNRFHPGCNCAVVPMWGLQGLEGYNPDFYKERAHEWFVQRDAVKDKTGEARALAEQAAAKMRPPVSFVPANSIAEAEEYAQRFVDLNEYKAKIDYRGMTLEAANELNSVLDRVYSEYDLPKMASIQRMDKRANKFRETTADAAYEWFTHRLYYNSDYLKTAAASAAHIKEGSDLLATVLSGADGLIAKYGAESRKGKYLLALKQSGRQLVAQTAPNYYEAVFAHEIGHALDDMLFYKHKKSAGLDIAASMRAYGNGLSGYATTSAAEYLAESFSAYYIGETARLDPALVSFFEGLRK